MGKSVKLPEMPLKGKSLEGPVGYGVFVLELGSSGIDGDARDADAPPNSKHFLKVDTDFSLKAAFHGDNAFQTRTRTQIRDVIENAVYLSTRPKFNIQEIHIVATSGFRDPNNFSKPLPEADAFIKSIVDKLNSELPSIQISGKVLHGSEEAALAAKAARPGTAVVLDIGGESTEYAGIRNNENIVASGTLALGVKRTKGFMDEQYASYKAIALKKLAKKSKNKAKQPKVSIEDKAHQDAVKKAKKSTRAYIREQIASISKKDRGTLEEFTNLASIGGIERATSAPFALREGLQIGRFDPPQFILKDTFTDYATGLEKMDREELLEMGIDEARHDYIEVANLIREEFMSAFGITHYIPRNGKLRDAVHDAAGEDRHGKLENEAA